MHKSIEWIAGLGCCVVLAGHPAGAAEQAHVHGVARLNVGVEATKLVLQLESPLDNLLGFEHAPRTAAERSQAASLVARLKAGAALFRVDPAAQCVLATVDLSSAALNLGKPAKGEEGHADIDGSFEFTCGAADKAAFIDTALFQFPRLQRVDVQVVTPAGQFRRDLKRPAARIGLQR